MKNEDILALLNNIKKGCEDSKTEFCKILRPKLKKVCRKYAFLLDDVESDVNWVLAKLISKIDMFDLSKNPMPFICRTMTNHCIDEARKKNVRNRDKNKYIPITMEESYTPTIKDGLEIHTFGILTDLDRQFVISKWVENNTREETMTLLNLTAIQYKIKSKKLRDTLQKELLKR